MKTERHHLIKIHYIANYASLKGNYISLQPHLFHGPLDDEPLMACVKTSLATPILNKKWGFEAWLMPSIVA